MNQKNKTKQTFISKYKPYYLKDFYMDNHVYESILNFLHLDYMQLLFVGNPCSGKTSLLNAIIREYYKLKESDNFPENNIMYVNNLKEQGIQYFRNDMKTFCQSHSIIRNKKKMVIIDDIDMINEQGQQVFRNYIDKYKHTIHFIFVCTSLQKVNESVQSRMHILELPSPNENQVRRIMNDIIQKENLEIDEESKNYLMLISNDSIRLLINYLEKIFILNQPVNLKLCKKLCSTISFQQFDLYLNLLKQKDVFAAINVMYKIYDYGYSVIDILDYFFNYIKLTTNLTEEEKYKLIPYLCKYITVFHNLHEHQIELAFFSNNIMNILTN
tara:strand:+ start:362 stop:1345 length:984 start_codon:yes stop_codon:yes gene_type:complete